MKLDAELIYGFSETFLKPWFDSPEKTPAFHHDLWKAFCHEKSRVAIGAPRGHAKSTAGTLTFALASMCFRVNDHIMIMSDTESQACQFLGSIKQHLSANKPLIEAFNISPIDMWEKETESEIIFSFLDGRRCRIFARGSEQKVRGTTWETRRPNLVLMDDCENDEMVLNEERRRKFINQFQNKILPLGNKGCLIRVVGTILHSDSLLQNLLTFNGKDEQNRAWDGLKEYPLETSISSWYALRFKAHNEDFSQILWPEMFSKERLLGLRDEFTAFGNISGYAQEYLNTPIDQSDAYFRQDDMKDISSVGEIETYYISGDLAISQKDSRAFTVFVVAGVNSEGIIRIRDVVRFRGDAFEIIETLFALQKRWKPDLFFLEQENIARTLGPIIYSEMDRRNQWFSIEEMTASQDKVKRARAMQSRYRAGTLEVDHSKEWFYEYSKEMYEFPRGKYMDQVDATAWVCIGLDKLVNAPTPHELFEEEYNRIQDQTLAFGGRNAYTGY
jgi:predicted phage terminase large subunit-like protein